MTPTPGHGVEDISDHPALKTWQPAGKPHADDPVRILIALRHENRAAIEVTMIMCCLAEHGYCTAGSLLVRGNALITAIRTVPQR